MGRFSSTNTVDIENTPTFTSISARGIRIGGQPQGNAINNGHLKISDGMNALKIIGADANQSRRVCIDGTTTIREHLTVRGICGFAILNANAVGATPLNIIQDTTRNELDASTKFHNDQPLINESTTISAGMISTKDYDVWHVHAPSAATRVGARGIQVGNQTDPENDHANGSITASEYEVGALCMVGIGAPGTHRITCWETGGFYVAGNVTTDAYLNWSDTKMKDDVLDVNNAKCVHILRRVSAKTYKRNDQELFRDNTRIGFIAQDIHSAVSNEIPDAMAYGRLVCILWGEGAVEQLQDRVATLEGRL